MLLKILEENIPEWQKQETLKRLAEIKENPGSTNDEESFFTAFEKGHEKI